MKKFKRVLIANRGEIALRIIRTLRDLGIESVAIYSDADSRSLHVSEADYAVNLPGMQSGETYLDFAKVLTAVKDSGADAVHPGYGFLAENAAFVSALKEQTDATFIGPKAEAMDLVGDKIKARNLAISLGIPVVPGTDEALSSLGELEAFAREHSYPLMLKAALGGGGRGMHVLKQEGDLKEAFERARRESEAYFANPSVFVERYITEPRHVEFQILRDQHGQGVSLFERECTIQRRHQKLFEEAPSKLLSPAKRRLLGEEALRIAAAVDYVGAGTVEFLVLGDEHFFMEVNPRIQVEHPITEMITGVDIVREQLRIAQGGKLDLEAMPEAPRGWAMEVRINGEDARQGFMPSTGVVRRLRLPAGPFVRVDTHLYEGYSMPAQYDSLLAKVIAWGGDREECRTRMQRALLELDITGITTTRGFHLALLEHPGIRDSEVDTGFLQREEEYFAQTLLGKASEPGDESCAVASFLRAKHAEEHMPASINR